MRPNTPARSLFRRLLLGFMVVMLTMWCGLLLYHQQQAESRMADLTGALNSNWVRKLLVATRPVAHRPERIRDIGAEMDSLRTGLDRELDIDAPYRTRIWQDDVLVYGGANEGETAAPAPLGADWVRAVERDPRSGITVESRQRVMHNDLLSMAAWRYLAMPLLVGLPVLLLPAWLIVRFGLRPLYRIVRDIELRGPGELGALPGTAYRELSPLVAAVNRLMQRLGERLSREQEFLADAAHELKTPLAVIQFNAHLMAGGMADAADSAAQAAHDGLREGIARANHTVRQLLAFERAGGEGGQPLPILDLAELVRDSLALVAPLGLRRAVEVELQADAPCHLALERESMASLLDNVIGNAVRYTPDGGRVVVALNVVAGRAVLRVNDQGPGIPPALRVRVFERFYRIPGQDDHGSGLGLAIAERAAARNGATITLEDGEQGVGLTVVIVFAAALAG